MKTLIETVVSTMSIPMGFVYGHKYEFNLSADNETVWPLAVLLPLIMKKNLDSVGKVETLYFVQILFLNKTDFQRDPESTALPVLESLEDLVDEFIVRLSKAQKWRIPFNEIEFVISSIPPEFDVPTDGYIVEFEVTPFVNKAVCL